MRNSTPLRADDDQQHAGGQQIEEEPRDAEILAAGVRLEILAPIDGRQHRHQRDRRRKDRRKRVDFHVGRTQRQRPRQPQRLRLAGNEHAERLETGPTPPPSSALAVPIRQAAFGLLPTANASEAPGQ